MSAMQLLTDKALLDMIETFLVQHDMKPTRFGVLAMNDGSLVFQLREGKRSLSLRNAERVVRFMDEYATQQTAL